MSLRVLRFIELKIVSILSFLGSLEMITVKCSSSLLCNVFNKTCLGPDKSSVE
jgi:hypothetical protein